MRTEKRWKTENREIIVRDFDAPARRDLEDEIEWLLSSLGFEGEEEGNEVPRGIFRCLLEASYKGMGVSSIELCKESKVTRGAVVYHLNRFIKRGVVVRRGREYYLRRLTLRDTLEEIEEDILRMMRRMIKVADEIDRMKMGGGRYGDKEEESV
ncbi:MAG: hypothetical protein QXP42_04290 [Candidatus Micrarchaeia archaeon]